MLECCIGQEHNSGQDNLRVLISIKELLRNSLARGVVTGLGSIRDFELFVEDEMAAGEGDGEGEGV